MTAAGSPPFFVVGAPRSGTTMLRLMLDSHPQLAVPFESGFIVDFYRRQAQYGDLSVRDNAARMLRDIGDHPMVRKGRLIPDSEAVLARSVRTYSDLADAIFRAYAQAQGKERWGDKTPGYVTDIDVLRAVFPTCRIVHLVRDGRDVALSTRNVEWGMRSLPRIAADWRWNTILAHKVGSVLGGDYLLIRYEDLVLEPEANLRSIAAFLDVPYTEAMLNYPQNGAEKMPAVSMQWHGNSVRPPEASLVGQWRRVMSRSDRIIFEQCARDALEMFGYDLERHPSTFGSRLRTLYYSTLRRY